MSRTALGPSSFVFVFAALAMTACPGGDDGDTGANDASSSTTNGPTTGDDSATGTDDAATETGDETAAGACDVPAEWSAPDWETNAGPALALRAQLDTLTGDATMRGAETGAVDLSDLEQLNAVWDGDPSLASVASPGYLPVVEASFEEFIAVLAAGPQELVDAEGTWMPGPDGGIWGDDARGINEGGLEVRQLVDKGGYSGGVLYAYALSLTEGEITPATIDAIAAAWGNNAALDPEGELTDAASYGYQMGFHAVMADALVTAKALAENTECVMERDEALRTFFAQWELSMLARTVFYGNRAEGKLLAATTGTELAGVLHDLAEGIGVAAGFYGLPDPASGPLSGGARVITDEQIAAVTGALGVDLDDLGASTTGTLLESLPMLEASVADTEAVLMEVYGLDAATIATYVMPTPG